MVGEALLRDWEETGRSWSRLGGERFGFRKEVKYEMLLKDRSRRSLIGVGITVDGMMIGRTRGIRER